MEESFLIKIRRCLRENDEQLKNQLIAEIEVRLALIIRGNADNDMLKVFMDVCDAYNLTSTEVMRNNRSRKKPYPEFRQVCFWVWTNLYGNRPTAYASYFGLDHCAALFGVKTVNNLLETNREFREKVKTLLPEYFK